MEKDKFLTEISKLEARDIEFSDDKKILIKANDDCLVQITIPKGVVEIGSSTLESCENLKNVSIPASVTKIAPDAFEDSRCKKQIKKKLFTPVGQQR